MIPNTFQLGAISQLNAAMEVPMKREIILKSPTGSGKTIILTHFMSEYMRGHGNVVFIWLTPGEGNLEEQSKAKMDRYCHNVSTKLLSDVMNGGFAAGDAVFINWQKLNRDSNNALREGERTNFIEWIEKARNSGVVFKVIIDESHHAFNERTNAIVQWFGTDKIIRASATPNDDPMAILVEVTEDDVIASGLIKKMIHVNPGFPMQVELSSDKDKTCYLLEQAMKKHAELVKAFRANGSNVNPLVVVQLPNNSDMLLESVEEWFADQHIDVENGTFAVWLSKRKDNLDDIENPEGKQVAVVIKQAVATGWDCPRAHILVKLRENMDERFEIQTIGRIRRMPEARHYGDDLLDGCYLFTFDERFTAGVIGSASDVDIGVKKLFIKNKHKAFSILKEQRTSVAETQDAAYALAAIAKWFRQNYKLGTSLSKNQTRLGTAGYVFGENIVSNTLSGDATTLAGMKSAARQMIAVKIRVPVSTHRHGRDFHHAIGEIGAANALPYNDMRLILYRVFGSKPTDVAKCLRLEAKAMYAFVINNMKRLRDDVTEALAADLKLRNDGEKTVEKEFKFPHEYLCAYDIKAKKQSASVKNVYDGYPLSAMTKKTRSKGEAMFENWCEQSEVVEWVFRNGDKGDEFFSIVYEDNSKRQRLFYPDYILCIGGKIWIVEVKGGWNASGASENIDEFAAKKSEALKTYCSKNKLRGGFVCYDENECDLLLSEDGFSDDKSAECWKSLKDVVAKNGR